MFEKDALELVVGDITCELTDAIVNPVGGLVDLAVHRAAGPLLLDEFHDNVFLRFASKLPSGQAVLTRGYGLAAPNVIHCAQPIYADGPARARADLATCHVEALRLAREAGFASLSFPAIGTGIYRFPLEEAAEIAMRTVVGELRAHGGPRVVRFVLADEETAAIYRRAASTHLESARGLTHEKRFRTRGSFLLAAAFALVTPTALTGCLGDPDAEEPAGESALAAPAADVSRIANLPAERVAAPCAVAPATDRRTVDVATAALRPTAAATVRRPPGCRIVGPSPEPRF